jgi:hypothetical protein
VRRGLELDDPDASAAGAPAMRRSDRRTVATDESRSTRKAGKKFVVDLRAIGIIGEVGRMVG